MLSRLQNHVVHILLETNKREMASNKYQYITKVYLHYKEFPKVYGSVTCTPPPPPPPHTHRGGNKKTILGGPQDKLHQLVFRDGPVNVEMVLLH